MATSFTTSMVIYLSSVSLSGLLLFSLYLQLTLVTLYIRIKRFSEQSVVLWSIIHKQKTTSFYGLEADKALGMLVDYSKNS